MGLRRSRTSTPLGDRNANYQVFKVAVKILAWRTLEALHIAARTPRLNRRNKCVAVAQALTSSKGWRCSTLCSEVIHFVATRCRFRSFPWIHSSKWNGVWGNFLDEIRFFQALKKTLTPKHRAEKNCLTTWPKLNTAIRFYSSNTIFCIIEKIERPTSGSEGTARRLGVAIVGKVRWRRDIIGALTGNRYL